MRRGFKDLISFEAVRHLKYIPKIIYTVKNWYPFLMNYIGIRNCGCLYTFRNGIRIKTGEGVDSATIAVIFIKGDYPKIKDESVVIDVGANIGVFSIYAVSESKNSKVYSYEPMKTSYDLLLKNIELNNLENSIRPFNLGWVLKDLLENCILQKILHSTPRILAKEGNT